MKFNIQVRLMAEWLHNNYNEVADLAEWKVQVGTKTNFNSLPANNKQTMLLLASRLLEFLEDNS